MPSPEPPFCALSVTVNLDDGSVNHGVFQVGLVREGIEDAFENIGGSPVAEPPKRRAPVAEPLR